MKKGIKNRLMLSFLYTSGIIFFVMLFTCVLLLVSVNSIAKSYESNKRLNHFTEIALQTEMALEDYVNIKTYKTIDAYFASREDLEREVADFCKKPSTNHVLQQEFIVYKLTESFLGFADGAVYARRSDIKNQTSILYKEAQKNYKLLKKNIEKLNQLYFVENLQSYNRLRSIIFKMTIFCIAVVFLSILVNFFLVYYLVSKITDPLIEISESANRLANRDFDIPIFTYDRQDEIGNICRAFNRMILSIREYIDTIWEKAIEENELREKEMKMNELYQDAKLTALQAQINPHFLFNTLNTGAQLAMMEGSDKTCDFLEQVADFYRYNIQFNGQESLLENEIQLLESYVYIMKTRFGDRFDFNKKIEIDNLNIKIPGMILQPLVENCIKHGFAGITKGGIIELRVFKSGKYVFVTVSDNGVGFPEEKRNFTKRDNSVINSKEDSGTGIGLKNVHARLCMYYKTDDVFDIQESESGGTKFVIRIKNV